MSLAKITIGLISDTHDLLRPEARIALTGVDRIIHAGDVCTRKVIDQLNLIAPVTVVRGNNDRDEWARTLHEVETLEIGGVKIGVLHDLNMSDAVARTKDAQVIVSGHSHRPSVRKEHGVLYVNPGSAGPRRFTLPVSVGFLEIEDGKCKARLQTLEID